MDIPKPLVNGDKCPCGARMPWHLIKLGLNSHTCSCERTYKVEDGKAIPAGTKVNPFARARGGPPTGEA